MFLKQIGYDVAILVSEAYGHAILGVNIPGSGNMLNTEVKISNIRNYIKGGKLDNSPQIVTIRKWRVALN